MYLRQRLFNNSLVIAAGRLAPGSTFAIMPVLNNYVNAAINPGLFVLGINDATFTFYPPGAEWGAQAIYHITPRFEVAAGVFNTNLSSALGGKGGLNFALQQGNRGALSVVQVNYLFNDAPEIRVCQGSTVSAASMTATNLAASATQAPPRAVPTASMACFNRWFIAMEGPAARKA